MKKFIPILLISLLSACGEQKKETVAPEIKVLKALIIDGQNNHYVWPKTTMMMRGYLEETSLFEVDVYRMVSIWLVKNNNPTSPEAYLSSIEKYP